MKNLINHQLLFLFMMFLLGLSVYADEPCSGCEEGELRFHFIGLVDADDYINYYEYFLKTEKISPEWYHNNYNEFFLNTNNNLYMKDQEISIYVEPGFEGWIRDFMSNGTSCTYNFAYGNYKFSVIRKGYVYINNGTQLELVSTETLSYFTVDYTDGDYNNSNPTCFPNNDMYIKFVYNSVDPQNSIFYYAISRINSNCFDNSVSTWNLVQNHIVPFISEGRDPDCNRKVDVFQPAVPSNLRIQNNSILNWDCNGETFLLNYIIYRKQGSGSPAPVCTLDNIKTQGHDDPIYWQKGHSFSWTEPNPHGIVRYYIVAKNMSGSLTNTSPILAYNYDLEKNSDQDNETSKPSKYELYSNYPNPFNPTTTIKYALKEDVKVSLKIYNTMGQEVRTLVNENQSAGYKQVQWDGKNDRGVTVPSGLYIYKMIAGSFVKAQKMVLMK